MRLELGAIALAVILGGCAQDKAAALALEWGCGPVDGVGAISGEAAPDWILVGEFTETNEAPAAIVDLACNLASDGKTLYVGVSDYLGGATDAETDMRARLNALIAKGAPIVLGLIGGEDHPYSPRERSKAERAWAMKLHEKVRAAGAARALLLVSRADAIAEPIPPAGERFAGYSPMPVFLEGGVISLEIAINPIQGAPGPAVRLYPAMRVGFHGQLALNRLTRPLIALALPQGRDEGRDDDHDDRPAAGAGRRGEDEAAREREALARADAALRRYAPTLPLSEPERQRVLEDLVEQLPAFEAQ